MGLDRTGFIKTLYEHCEGDLELRALPSKRQAFIPLGKYTAIDKFCEAHSKENVYFAVATRNGGGTKEHIVNIPAVWTDIDFKDIPWQQARARIKDLSVQPTFVVTSGGGYHVYWMLKEAHEKSDILLVEAVNKSLARVLGGDSYAVDASRILRLPETKNFKYKPPKEVTCKYCDVSRLYDLSDFDILTDLHTVVSLDNNNTIYNTTIANTVPSNNSPHLTTDNHNLLFKKGHRDHSIFHVANCLAKGKMDSNNIREVIEILAKTCDPPFKDIDAKVDSALKRCGNKERIISEEIEKWALTTDGHFLTTECHRENDLTTVSHKKAGNMALIRLVERGILEKYGTKRGCYRLIDKTFEKIEYLDINVEPTALRWPLETITAMVEIFEKNLIVVAGESNAGKTAFMLDFARLNMNDHEIIYFSSEMGGPELRKRLLQFGEPLESWKWTVGEMGPGFLSNIRKDSINIIDFMEIHDNFFQVGGLMREIFDKLDKGIALIALQKNKGTDYGLGGARSLEKPRLYLSLSQEYPGGRCKIVKAKNWATSNNPNGYSVKYKLIAGCRFRESGEWQLEK